MGRFALVAALVAGASSLHSAQAAHAAVGTPIVDRELARADGQGKARVFADEKANVLVFFRPGQKHSVTALRELARCQKDLAGKSVRWVGIVADSAPSDAVATLVRDSGFAGTVLVDAGDALYGSLGLALHPVVVIAGQDRKLSAFEPFHTVDFCPAVSANVRHALREINDEELRKALAPPEPTAPLGAGQGGKRYRALAEALLKSGNTEKALESALKSVELEPGSAASHAVLGTVYAARQDCAKAIPAFNQALALDATNASAKDGLERCKAAR